MTDSDTTVPSGVPGLPVREVRVEVIKGRAAGAKANATQGAITVGSAPGNTLTIDDRTVSRIHLEVGRNGDRILITDLGSTNGSKIGPVLIRGGSVLVEPGTVISLGRTELQVGDGETVVPAATQLLGLEGIVTQSMPLRLAVHQLVSAGRTRAPVLIVGEEGTGKSAIASALHRSGGAAGGFVTLDCPTLAKARTSTLVDHPAWREANGGTILLQEVGELGQEDQGLLCDIIDGKFGEPNLRIIATTARDLRSDVNRSAFREDLYYRLAALTVQIPPLRSRPEDIPVLIERFLVEEGFEGHWSQLFSARAVAELQEHHWPRNASELREVVATAMATGESPVLAAQTADDVGEAFKDAKAAVIRDFELTYLTKLLDASRGNISKAARLARMNRSYLIELIARHKLST